ncbi:uncharacterized protein J7T54_002823 [Emericellopsis cladophorae]|uniref:S-adenosylmethionine-dependent methyltransferase-like protein n=1 Tax=Emericellopsis cladophorae TaxID=2686198 RepID=A0A9Q0BCH1_9HYPO|nr:uncharacterized protein J7T54_002823 [Emericellopsis cladophorae]KAI6779555.1 hypothetical protein J7T54_002823 [Emericellopsis cladophorae]
MPQFSLGRHTNRSSNALAEPATPGAGGPGQQPHQQPNPKRGHVYGQSRTQSQADPNAPPSAGPSDDHYPSRESSLPHPPRQQIAQSVGTGGAPLPSLHDIQQQGPYESSDPAAHEVSGFDARQAPDSTVNRSRSQRFSNHVDPRQRSQYQSTQQFTHPHGYSSTSLEDLSSSAAYSPTQHSQAPIQAQVPGQEKKSKRKFIKGILFSSSKSQNDQNQQQAAQQQAQQTQQLYDQGQSFTGGSSYDNITGLARRPSKRENNPPAINTRLSKPLPPGHHYQEGEWNQGQGSYSLEASPLHDVGENEQVHYISGEVDRDYRLREGQDQSQGQGQGQPELDPTTIRPVAQDSDSSPYDDEFHNQHHLPPQSHNQQLLHQQQQQQVGLPHPQQLQPHSQQLSSQQPLVQQGSRDQQQLQHQRSQPHDELQQQQNPQFPPPPSHQPQQPLLAEQQQQFGSAPSSYQQQVGEPRLVSSHLGAPPPQHQKHHQQQQQHPASSETISQASYESPVTDPDQPSGSQQSVQPSPGPNHTDGLVSSPNLPTAPLVLSPQPQHAVMAPPPAGAPPANRGDKAARSQGEVTAAGLPPSYRQSNSSVGALNIPANQSGSQPASAGGPFRADVTPRFESPGLDQGRHSPQPERGVDDDKSFKDLLTKYKNVKRLYFEGKNRLEELTGQVEVLQNAVANQRITQSRTALDDSEYLTRFNRLNGAINNLSFNIRKDWKSLPSWIALFASPEALSTGTKEMTALGRGVISRWLADELFGKCFHPGLDPMLSAQLKQIEQSIRGNAYTMHSQEEFAALTNKVVQWRMTTLDGLQKVLGSSAADENRQALIAKASAGLTAYLCQHLNQPAPPGVDGSTSMIVELAVGIAANTPLESRDVAITYPLPRDIVRPEIMEIGELELPALEKDGDSESSMEDGKDKAQSRDTTRVRFAGFMAWEVRGRQVLFKAPVWTL